MCTIVLYMSLFFVFDLLRGCGTTSGQPYAHAQKSSQTVHHGLRNTSFKRQAIHPDIPPDHPTWQSHLSPVTSLTENLSSSRSGPRIISGTLRPNRIGLRAQSFSTNSLIDGTYCPTIQHGNPISCQSRHGPGIFCRRRVTVQESVANALQPEFGRRPITAPRICLLLRAERVSLVHVPLTCFLCETVSFTNTSFVMYINDFYT